MREFLGSRGSMDKYRNMVVWKDVPKFSGADDKLTVDLWLSKARNALLADVGELAKRGVELAAGKLEGAVWTWYSERFTDNDNRTPFETWMEFERCIRLECRTGNTDRQLRKKLRALKQTGPVRKYNQQFREFKSQISNFTEEEAISLYIDGLKSHTAAEVEYRDPINLRDAMEIAQAFDEARFGRTTSVGRVGNNRTYNEREKESKRSEWKRGDFRDDPMELDIITCYQCGGRGHIQKQCPSEGKKNERKAAHGKPKSRQLNTASADTREEPKKEAGGIELNLTTNNRHHELIILDGELHGSKVKFMVDSGATHNFLYQSMVAKLKLNVKKGESTGVKLGDGSSVSVIGEVDKLDMLIGPKFHCRANFVVLPGNQNRIILGRNWLYEHNPTIDWRSGKVRVEQPAKDELKLPSSSNMELSQISMTGRQFRKCLSKPDTEVYLGFLKSMPNVPEQSIKEKIDQAQFDDEGKQKLAELLQEYSDVFPSSLPGIPPIRGFEHQIKLIDDQPIYKKQYRLSPAELAALKEQLGEMLKLGLIEPTKSPFGAPVLFVKKNDGSLRMVVDFRELNKKTVRDRFSVPRLDDLWERAAKSKYLSKFDLQQGFYQIRISDDSLRYTVGPVRIIGNANGAI